MKIKKIVLKNSGFKGLDVTYLREEEKNGRPFINEVTEKRKHPIHLGLETMFRDLRFYLLDITGMLKGDEDKADKDFLILETEVVSLEFDLERFVLGGEKVVFRDKKIKLKTPKVDSDDGYEHYETVMKMIASIVDETKEYMAGTKKVDDVEVAIRYVQAGKSKDITMDQLEKMNPEQLKDWATRYLENAFGSVVMHNDDYEPNEEDLQKHIEEAVVIMDESEEEGSAEEESHGINLGDLSQEEIVIQVPINQKPAF